MRSENDVHRHEKSLHVASATSSWGGVCPLCLVSAFASSLDSDLFYCHLSPEWQPRESKLAADINPNHEIQPMRKRPESVVFRDNNMPAMSASVEVRGRKRVCMFGGPLPSLLICFLILY